MTDNRKESTREKENLVGRIELQKVNDSHDEQHHQGDGRRASEIGECVWGFSGHH